MVRVEMLAVGKELLIGRTLNTNAHWIGKRLARLGIMLNAVTTIDDDLTEIASSFGAITRRAPDFLIVVGGLGPTPDDMTLEGVARALGTGLRSSPEALRMIRTHYAKRGMADVELTPARLKMARLPAGAEPVVNDTGTAPGVRLEAEKTTVYCLPGVPAEMRGIFIRTVEPDIRGRVGKLYRSLATMKLEGVLESALAPAIGEELKRHPGAYVKSHPRGVRKGVSRIELDVAVVGESKTQAEKEGAVIRNEMERAVAGLGGRVRETKRGVSR